MPRTTNAAFTPGQHGTPARIKYLLGAGKNPNLYKSQKTESLYSMFILANETRLKMYTMKIARKL